MSAQTKHSPAPWAADDDAGCKNIYDANGEEIASTVGFFDEELDQANADLMAAAPRLLAERDEALELLKDLLPVAEIHAEIEMSGRAADNVLDSVQRARALIARALLARIEGAQS